MPHIHTDQGSFDTKDLPNNISPAFCATCGERTGWYDEDISDMPVMYCDECAYDIAEEEN